VNDILNHFGRVESRECWKLVIVRGTDVLKKMSTRINAADEQVPPLILQAGLF
jgi:hypothetical protein